MGEFRPIKPREDPKSYCQERAQAVYKEEPGARRIIKVEPTPPPETKKD